MSNIDTSGTKLWGQTRPPQSSLTTIASQVTQIRRWHNEEFLRLLVVDGWNAAVRARVAEDRAISSALHRHGWTERSLEAALEQRTTKRWARKIIQGWV